MSTPTVAQLRGVFTSENYQVLQFWCPGCDDVHQINTKGEAAWEWDGNLEAPTVSPSILVLRDVFDGLESSESRCHSFLKGGVWQFLGDCTHSLAGKTVPMVPLPEWLISEQGDHE